MGFHHQLVFDSHRCNFSVLVFGTKPSETSTSRYISAPRLLSDMCTSYCAYVNSAWKQGQNAQMYSFQMKRRGVDEFSVWNSRKGYMEKEFLMHPVKIFKVHFWISVETAWHLDTKKESKVCCYIPFYFSYFHCLLKIRHRFAQYNEVTNRKVISELKIRVPTVTQK